MMICVQCAREMQCVKSGIGADFGYGHVYAGDKYMCPKCGVEVIKTNPEAHHDPNHEFHDEFLMMNKP